MTVTSALITGLNTDTGVSDTDFITNDPSLTISGTYSKDSANGQSLEIWVSVNGGAATSWGSVNLSNSSQTNANWSFTFPNPHNNLTDGTYTVTLKVGPTTFDSQAIIVDTVAPTSGSVTITSITDDFGIVTSTSLTDGSSADDTSPTLTGTTTVANAKIGVYSADGTILRGYTTADASGNWTFTSPTSGDSTYEFRAYIVDTAGNRLISSWSGGNNSFDYTLDTSTPSYTNLSINSVVDNVGPTVNIANNGTTDDNTPTLNGSIGDPSAGRRVAIYDNGAFLALVNPTGTNWSYTPTALGNGQHVFSVRVADALGNVRAVGDTHTINVNVPVNTAPTDIGLSANTVVENAAAGTVIGALSTTDANVGDTFTYSIVSGAAAFDIVGDNLVAKAGIDYEAGATRSVTVRSTDSGGLTTSKTFTINVTDTNDVAPVITSGASATFAENGGGTVYTATATDGDASSAFRNITYSLAAGGDNDLFNINPTTGVVTFKASPNFEAPLDSDKNNTYVLSVKASDGVNLATPKTVTVTVTDQVEDSGPANTAGLSITSTAAIIRDATPLITGVAGTGLQGQTVTLFEGTTARGTGVVQANGTWSIESSNVGADGAHTFTAQLGSSTSNSVTLTIDTVAPVVAITGTTGSGFSPTVNGTASVVDVGRTVTILDGTTVVGSGTVGAGGAFSVSTGLTGTGAHSLTARVVDLAGNVGTSAVNTYTIAPQPAQGQIDSDNLDAAYLNIMYAASVRVGDKDFMLDLKTKLSLNLVTYKEALDAVIDRADGSTSVATLSYQFFTGKIPTKAGLDYLLTTTGGNANNLNSAYYQDFNIENRFINFAVNLGHDGEGKAGFQTKYGALSLFDATKKAYAEIFGTAATDTKIQEILDTGVSLGGKTMARSGYFEAYGHDAIGTKAAMVGWLLSEAAKSDIGVYAKANEAFLNDLSDGATFGVDLIGVYGAKAIPAEVIA